MMLGLRIGRKWAIAVVVAVLASAITVFTVVLPARAVAPSITAPERVYGLVNVPVPFIGDDPISDDTRTISVEATDSAPTCDNTASPFSISGCPRVQLTTSNGTLAVGVLDDFDGTDPPAFPDGLAIGGAVYASGNGDGTGTGIALNGDETQLNAALATLTWTPDNDYENDNGNPASIDILLNDDEDENPTFRIEIRIDDLNEGPEFCPTPSGDTDCPAQLAVAAGSTTLHPDPAPPSVGDPGRWVVEDPDVETPGAELDEMLYAAFTTCGQFSLRGTFPISDELEALLGNYIDEAFDIDDGDPVEVAARDAAILTIMGLLPSEITDQTFGTSDPLSLNTFFAGIGSLDEVNHAMSQITFEAPAAAGVCNLVQFVTDLGNNGLPLPLSGYVGSPVGGIDDPQPGIEVPDLGFDITVTSFVVGEGIEVSIPSTTSVTEGETAVIPVSVTGDGHPTFDVSLVATPVTAPTTDYTDPTSPLTIPADDPSVPFDVATVDNGDIDGSRTLTVQLSLVGAPPGVTLGNDTILVTILDDEEESTTTTTEDTVPEETTTTTEDTVPEETTTTTEDTVPEETTTTTEDTGSGGDDDDDRGHGSGGDDDDDRGHGSGGDDDDHRGHGSGGDDDDDPGHGSGGDDHHHRGHDPGGVIDHQHRRHRAGRPGGHHHHRRRRRARHLGHPAAGRGRLRRRGTAAAPHRVRQRHRGHGRPPAPRGRPRAGLDPPAPRRPPAAHRRNRG